MNNTVCQAGGMGQMDFKQLESFVAAVDEGIRNLETELGTRLLNRTTRSMELSSDGKLFYSYAKQILKLNRDSIFALSQTNHDENTIQIMTTPYISRYYVASRVVAFLREHPEASFNFVTCNNSDIHPRLQKDGVEFAFCNMKILNSDYSVKHFQMTNPVVITPNSARFQPLVGQPFPVERFGDEPLITRSSTSTLQREFLRWSKQNIPNIKLKVVAAIDDTETIKQLVAEGVGIAVISEETVKDLVASGKVLSFPLLGTMPYHLYFVYKKKYLTAEQAAFRDFVLAHVPLDAPEEDEA